MAFSKFFKDVSIGAVISTGLGVLQQGSRGRRNNNVVYYGHVLLVIVTASLVKSAILGASKTKKIGNGSGILVGVVVTKAAWDYFNPVQKKKKLTQRSSMPSLKMASDESPADLKKKEERPQRMKDNIRIIQQSGFQFLEDLKEKEVKREKREQEQEQALEEKKLEKWKGISREEQYYLNFVKRSGLRFLQKIGKRISKLENKENEENKEGTLLRRR